MMRNHPDAWVHLLPRPVASSHKYTRGHTLVIGGARLTGAARLAARAALRIGSGLVSVLSPEESFAIYATALTAAMVRPLHELADLLQDPQVTACIIGPGLGAGEEAQRLSLDILAAGKPAVLDADALTSFAGSPQSLFDALHRQAVLTPHAGEYARLFADLPPLDAARQAGAVLVAKAAQTVIAAPDGRVTVNDHASPYLATAGSGDVLAGMIGGLLAQGMPVYEAACAGVWLHGDAALRFGPGLIAEDLPEMLPHVLRDL